MARDGIKPPDEKVVTNLFMAHYQIATANDHDVVYDEAKIVQRTDWVRHSDVLLGKFHIPEGSGLPESHVTFVAHAAFNGPVYIILNVINASNGLIENYVEHGLPNLGQPWMEFTARFLAYACSGVLDLVESSVEE